MDPQCIMPAQLAPPAAVTKENPDPALEIPIFRMLDSEEEAKDLVLVTANVLRSLSPPPHPRSDSDSECYIDLSSNRINAHLPGRLTGAPRFSDGQTRTHPIESDNVVACHPASSELAKLWLRKLGLSTEDGLGDFPEGYKLFLLKEFGPTGEKTKFELYGHPSGKAITSPEEFLDHVNYFILGDPDAKCPCNICEPEISIHIESPTSKVDHLSEVAVEEDLELTINLTSDGHSTQAEAPDPASNLSNGRSVVPQGLNVLLADEIDDDDESDDEEYNPAGSNRGDAVEGGMDEDDDDDDDEDDVDWAPKKEGNKRPRSPSVDEEFDDTDVEVTGDGGIAYKRVKLSSDESARTLDQAHLRPAIQLRVGEVCWCISADLVEPQYADIATLWPALIASEAADGMIEAPLMQESLHATIIPMPLPSLSEINHLLHPPTIETEKPPSVGDIDQRLTPGHYVPKATQRVSGPRRIAKAALLPFLTRASPAVPNSCRHWYRAMIQAVNATTSYEVTRMRQQPYSSLSAFPPEEGEAYVDEMRWGADVIRVGDVVQLTSIVEDIEDTAIREPGDGVGGLNGDPVVTMNPMMMPYSHHDPVRRTRRTLRLMKVNHMIRSGSKRVEIEGDVFHVKDLEGENSAIEYAGLVRWKAHRYLLGRWHGKLPAYSAIDGAPSGGASRPERVSVVAEVVGLWEGWIGPKANCAELSARLEAMTMKPGHDDGDTMIILDAESDLGVNAGIGGGINGVMGF
ncbi:hypothetical protein HK101_000466 [Irineochytrium annulatum]|nr:hypothetical protein HK101_000466 [Irineochytrium annulatum]